VLWSKWQISHCVSYTFSPRATAELGAAFPFGGADWPNINDTASNTNPVSGKMLFRVMKRILRYLFCFFFSPFAIFLHFGLTPSLRCAT
jgi:hypothetical protein